MEMEKLRTLISELNGLFNELNVVEASKMDALKKDQVITVEELMKKEQALTLQFRSYEKKAQRMLEEEGMPDGTLRDLIAYANAADRQSLMESFERLQREVQIWKEVNEEACKLLKIKLHRTNRKLSESGIYDSHGKCLSESGFLKGHKT